MPKTDYAHYTEAVKHTNDCNYQLTLTCAPNLPYPVPPGRVTPISRRDYTNGPTLTTRRKPKHHKPRGNF